MVLSIGTNFETPSDKAELQRVVGALRKLGAAKLLEISALTDLRPNRVREILQELERGGFVRVTRPDDLSRAGATGTNTLFTAAPGAASNGM